MNRGIVSIFIRMSNKWFQRFLCAWFNLFRRLLATTAECSLDMLPKGLQNLFHYGTRHLYYIFVSILLFWCILSDSCSLSEQPFIALWAKNMSKPLRSKVCTCESLWTELPA